MNPSDPFDYSAHVAGAGHNAPPNELEEILKLAHEQLKLEEQVENLEAQLAIAKEDLEDIAKRRLPEAMEKAGLGDTTLSDGTYIKVKEKVRGGIPAENKEKGYDWLDKNGFGALVKSEVVIPFGRKDLDTAKKLVEELRSVNPLASLERDVHYQTLEAFIREQLAKGTDIPLDIFNVYRERIAKVGKKGE